MLPLVSPDLTEALLVSAYDLHHEFLPDQTRLLSASHARTLYAIPSLLVVDSGGYELSDTFESGETRRGPRKARLFGRGDFEAIADRLPTDRALLVVTYDEPDVERAGYEEQRRAAQRFAAARPHLRIDFLIKPPSGDQFIVPTELQIEGGALCQFDVLGVTEKELGDTLIDRLVCLARLRRILDDSGAESVPVHVFGGLDPLLTPLYFAAGGEIFDGLSWLRYAYHEGSAIHPEELAVLTGAFEANQVRRDMLRYLSNLQQLARIKYALQRWSSEPDRYEVLGRHHRRIREVHETLQSRLRRED